MRGHVADVFDVDERRIAVIPNGIDPRDAAARRAISARCARVRRARREKLVLLVGRLVYKKGFQLALEALPSVIAQVRAVRFLVAGSGRTRKSSRRRRESLGWTSTAMFLGWIGDDVLHSLYRIADLCVVPSHL